MTEFAEWFWLVMAFVFVVIVCLAIERVLC